MKFALTRDRVMVVRRLEAQGWLKYVDVSCSYPRSVGFVTSTKASAQRLSYAAARIKAPCAGSLKLRTTPPPLASKRIVMRAVPGPRQIDRKNRRLSQLNGFAPDKEYPRDRAAQLETPGC